MSLKSTQVASAGADPYGADLVRLFLADDALILDLDREPVTVEVLAGDDQVLLHRDREGLPAAIEVVGLRAHRLLTVSRMDDDPPHIEDRAMEVAARLAAGERLQRLSPVTRRRPRRGPHP
jgi:hypothetical protein